MEREELKLFLQSFTEREKELLDAGSGENKGQCGAERPVYVSREEDAIPPGERIAVVRQERFKPVRTHSHSFIELNYVWSGSCVQTVDGQKIFCRSGDMCLLDSYAQHSLSCCGGEDIVVNLLLPEKYFRRLILEKMKGQGILSRFLENIADKQRNEQHFLKFETHGNDRTAWLFDTIMLEYYSRQPGREAALDNYITALFTELFRCMQDTVYGQKDPVRRRRSELVHRILAYIEVHYRECTLQQTADAFSFHRGYLTELLKQETGRSFMGHLQAQRIYQAEKLLLDTDCSIAEIAAQVGYSNVNFFYRIFRDAEGCTPQEFRRQERQRSSF